MMLHLCLVTDMPVEHWNFNKICVNSLSVFTFGLPLSFFNGDYKGVIKKWAFKANTPPVTQENVSALWC